MKVEINPDVRDGEIVIDAIELWWLLTKEQQEEVLLDNAHWRVVERALEDQLGLYYAGPNYYSSIHKLREKILTDPGFVDNMAVEFIRSLLRELANAEQKRRAAERAYWDLYHKVKELDRDLAFDANTPNELARKGGHIWFKSPTIKKEILENFRELLQEYANDRNK